MERALILLSILGGLYALMRFCNSSRSIKSNQPRPVAHRRNQARDAASINLLSTPGNNLLASNRKVWKARCQHEAQTGGTHIPQRLQQEPAYDGYSRRDRHHLMPAHIEDEKHIEGMRP